jgi:PleD family two-component response regulator
MSEGAGLRVLVADDDALLREIAAAALGDAGYEVQTVASGDAAVAACALRRPDIVLLDVAMPEGDGYQACASIRQLPRGTDLPILMITGYDDSPSIDRALDVGATDFVVKPVNWALLLHRIRYVLRGAHSLAALRLSEKKNAALLQSIPDGIFVIEADGTIVQCYGPLADLLTPSGGLKSRHPFAALVPPDLRPAAVQCLAEAAAGASSRFEFAFTPPLSSRRHFECRCLPHHDAQALAIVRDTSAQKLADERLHRLAYFDPLTGLPNRVWIRDYLSHSLVEAGRRGRSVAVLHLDLDRFSRLNDLFGHERGDAVLCQIAERLAMTLEFSADGLSCAATLASKAGPGGPARPRGQLARVAGDEFVIVLNGDIDLRQGQSFAEHLLVLHQGPLVHATHEVIVTLSIGLAMFPERGDQAQSLLDRAEWALNEAKSRGRNRLCTYDPAVGTLNHAHVRVAT